MPTFATPEPISVTLDLGLGEIRIVASDRTDTVVEVRPSNPDKQSDVSAAEQTRVDYDNGRLSIKVPRSWKYSYRSGGESVYVEIALPQGSHLRGQAGAASLRCTGRLGECRYKAGVGDVHVEQAGPVQIQTGGGDITVGHCLSDVEIATGTGAVRIERIDGAATIRNSNGDTWIGEIAGDLRVKAANGRIFVDRPQATVVAKTANGDVHLREVARESVVAHTACGTITVGILDGVPAWLDLNTHYGTVRNKLGAAERPGPGEDAVEVQARTAFGDVVVCRSSAVEPGTHGV